MVGGNELTAEGEMGWLGDENAGACIQAHLEDNSSTVQVVAETLRATCVAKQKASMDTDRRIFPDHDYRVINSRIETGFPGGSFL